MGGGYIELRAGADGRYLLIRASEWDPSITVRQPGVSRGVGEMALAGAMAAALQDGGATAHALWVLAQEMQGFGLPAPSSPRSDQAVIEAIGTAVRLRRVLVIRGAHLPGASEIEGDTPSMVRAVAGAVEPVRAPAGQNVAAMGAGERWLLVLQKMPSHLSWEGMSREARANAEAFFQPETLAMLAASLAVMAMNPAGVMALLAGGLLLSVSLFFAGQAVLEGAAQIADVFDDVEKAKSEKDLDRAARKLATGVEKIGVEMFIRIICRAGPKKRRGGSQQVQADGGGGASSGGSAAAGRRQSGPARHDGPAPLRSVARTPSSGVPLKADPGRTTTVLGSYHKDMKHIIDELEPPRSSDFGPKKGDFNILNVDTDLSGKKFFDTYNRDYLDRAIERNDRIYMATKPEGGVLRKLNENKKYELSNFGREYLYLQKRGYVYDPTTSEMVRHVASP